VTHYYGVGAYERPLDDARRAEVRFAAECLAFANVPQAEILSKALAVPAVHDPRWKARVPRDRGASWDFEDTRDHYLGRLYGADPARLRREDPGLYLDLSRAVTGEVMAAVFSEWRRPASPCSGGLVWTLQDLEAGAGWGIVDALGAPKPCWWMLRRVLQPRQVLITDEGVNGLALHLINETDAALEAELRFAVFGDEPGAIVDAARPVSLAPRSAQTLSAFELMGRFYDLTYAYRFGPRAHAMSLAQLRTAEGAISEAVHFVDGLGVPSGGEVAAELEADGDGWRLTLTSGRLHRFVHLAGASDDWFPLAPGEPKTLRLLGGDGGRPQGEIVGPGGRVLGGYG
jgi:beta-mannosidase